MAMPEWKIWTDTEQGIMNMLELEKHPATRVQSFFTTIANETGTQLLDWVDHLRVCGGGEQVRALMKLGYEVENVSAPETDVILCHPGAQLPRIAVRFVDTGKSAVVLRAESLPFLEEKLGILSPIAGTSGGPYAVCRLLESDALVVEAVERRGYRGFMVPEFSSEEGGRWERARFLWGLRQREFGDDTEGMMKTLSLSQELVALVGQGAASALVFEAERDYWQERNYAGQVQKERQDRLGLGWSNHDHHTFRSSREHFTLLVAILETFGFVCRERFYAGAQAGWGAQVLEQSEAGLVVFADVDLSPEEIEVDFAHSLLPQLAKLGTIGLWCGLHGESMLEAGLHHLEIQCDFDRARSLATDKGVKVMKPFTDLPHLHQTFTQGEMWPVSPKRLERLLVGGFISKKQHDTFLSQGAIGSHLEYLQREGGYKGFNTEGVSQIIRHTDPRSE